MSEIREMVNKDTIERVSRRVAEVLALEVETIDPRSRLMTDLNADSLDLVELMFLLEQEFDITLSRNDLSIAAQLGLPEEQVHQAEVLTPRALEILRERFPWANDILVDGIERKHLASLVTVEEIARSVDQKLQDR